MSEKTFRPMLTYSDEAHHTLAPSYRDTIEYIMKHRKNCKLLGLTATPVRANEKDSAALLKIFDNSIVYDIPMSELITRGILADPKFKSIETDEFYEETLDSTEKSYIKYRKELPPSVIKRIAESKARNGIILKEYLDNKDKYGKTLIFAMNQIHCRLLAEELGNKHIPHGVVYSGREDNTQVISDFKEGKFNVLVKSSVKTAHKNLIEFNDDSQGIEVYLTVIAVLEAVRLSPQLSTKLISFEK